MILKALIALVVFVLAIVLSVVATNFRLGGHHGMNALFNVASTLSFAVAFLYTFRIHKERTERRYDRERVTKQ